MLLVGLPSFNIVIKKKECTLFSCQMQSDIPVDVFFSFIFFLVCLFVCFLLRTFLSSAFLLSVLLNFFFVVVSITSTSFQVIFFQFVIVPSSVNQLPVESQGPC